MKSIRSLSTASALALALAAPLSHAGVGDTYTSTPFQGLTFTFTETTATTLTFNMSGTPSGDWATAAFFGAFDLKDLGLNFQSVTGTANGPGAVNLAGLNSQLSAASVDCQAAGSPPGSICFDISPDVSLGVAPINLTYTINFSSAMNIASTGPHLQVAFTETVNGPKVGSLYSLNITRDTCCTTVPEPSSSSLMILGFALVGVAIWTRRRATLMSA